MKKEIEFIGVDIAKHKFDVCMGQNNLKKQYPNTEEGFRELIKVLPLPEHGLIVMEPTGGYEKALIDALQAKNHSIVLANALKVRKYAQAMGLSGKKRSN